MRDSGGTFLGGFQAAFQSCILFISVFYHWQFLKLISTIYLLVFHAISNIYLLVIQWYLLPELDLQFLEGIIIFHKL